MSECCSHDHAHPDLQKIHGLMPDDDRLFDLADLPVLWKLSANMLEN